jgi:hypothetical protein
MTDIYANAIDVLKSRVAELRTVDGSSAKARWRRYRICKEIAEGAWDVDLSAPRTDFAIGDGLPMENYTFPETFEAACDLFQGWVNTIDTNRANPQAARSCVNAIDDLAKKLCKEDEEADKAPSVISQGTGTTGTGSSNQTGGTQN